MPQSLSAILLHLVFSTKNRQPLITERIERELQLYIRAILDNYRCSSLMIGGDVDHLHILFSMSRVISVADLIKAVKTSSSKWVKTKGYEFRDFQWQSGYGIFSIGESGVENVKRYIANQKQHHRRHNFQQELRELCIKYKVEIDERYVWD